jgi:hypothetical protein
MPKQPAANVAKLAPGFEPSLSGLAFVAALAGTLAWIWLVEVACGPSPFGHLEKHGAAGRRRDAVLAAADDPVVAVLDYARSYAPIGATHSGADQPPELRAGPWHEPRPAGRPCASMER